MLKRKMDWYLGAILGVRSVILLQIQKPAGICGKFNATGYIYNFLAKFEMLQKYQDNPLRVKQKHAS